MRKSPVAHKVGSYKRSNSHVKSYTRGRGIKKQTPSIFNKTKQIAYAVKDMGIGQKLVYAGGKTWAVITYTGSKVIEKGSAIYVNLN